MSECQRGFHGLVIKGVTLVLNPDYESILNSIDSVSFVFNVLCKLGLEESWTHTCTGNKKGGKTAQSDI